MIERKCLFLRPWGKWPRSPGVSGKKGTKNRPEAGPFLKSLLALLASLRGSVTLGGYQLVLVAKKVTGTCQRNDGVNVGVGSRPKFTDVKPDLDTQNRCWALCDIHKRFYRHLFRGKILQLLPTGVFSDILYTWLRNLTKFWRPRGFEMYFSSVTLYGIAPMKKRSNQVSFQEVTFQKICGGRRSSSEKRRLKKVPGKVAFLTQKI